MGEITLDLRLVVRVPEKGLTINGLIAGLKEGIPQIHEAILTALMKAIEERVVERWIQRDGERYRRNGTQSKARELKSSLGPIRYRLAQMIDRKTGKSFTPLVSALSVRLMITTWKRPWSLRWAWLRMSRFGGRQVKWNGFKTNP